MPYAPLRCSGGGSTASPWLPRSTSPRKACGKTTTGAATSPARRRRCCRPWRCHRSRRRRHRRRTAVLDVEELISPVQASAPAKPPGVPGRRVKTPARRRTTEFQASIDAGLRKYLGGDHNGPWDGCSDDSADGDGCVELALHGRRLVGPPSDEGGAGGRGANGAPPHGTSAPPRPPPLFGEAAAVLLTPVDATQRGGLATSLAMLTSPNATASRGTGERFVVMRVVVRVPDAPFAAHALVVCHGFCAVRSRPQTTQWLHPAQGQTGYAMRATALLQGEPRPHHTPLLTTEQGMQLQQRFPAMAPPATARF